MDRKLKNTIALLIVFILILIGGGVYSFVFQSNDIDEKGKRIQELNLSSYNTEDLMAQLNTLKKRVAELDSILALRKYNIPVQLDQSRFFDFVNQVSYAFNPDSYINIEYEEIGQIPNFNFYLYKLHGNLFFNEFYNLIFAIEQSKELKKVLDCTIDNIVSVDEEGVPRYQVTFSMKTAVYFANDDRFASSSKVENQLKPNPIYDIFYPLIRNEIPPNVDNLPDIQTGQLLALIPDGAFIADAKGNTYLLWEGDKVYLGYLTEIDYTKNEVKFILNKGGIIEKVTLTLDKEKKPSE
ncbi:MAG: hypothetical protein JW995_02760 [Melioribacteraceae bacterium]|nr:hypothetical protein [Melioribacteraceae bacterium]